METDIHRWKGANGARLVLTNYGRMLQCHGPGGKYEVISERASLEAAEAYAARAGYWPANASLPSEPRKSRRRLRVPAEHKPVRHKLCAGNATLTPEQQAEVDRRVEAHACRVENELRRLGQYRGRQ